MKLTPASREKRRVQAFTLAEMMVVMGVLVFLILCVILANIYGAAMATRQAIWISASDSGRKTLGGLMQDVRAANHYYIGNGGMTGFTNLPDDTNQTGNSVILYPTTSNTTWVMYYYNAISNSISTSNTLVRTNYVGSISSSNTCAVEAKQLTNDNYIFTAVDYTGINIQTNTNCSGPLQIYLSFVRGQNPNILIDPTSFGDLYQLKTCIFPRQRQ